MYHPTVRALLLSKNEKSMKTSINFDSSYFANCIAEHVGGDGGRFVGLRVEGRKLGDLVGGAEGFAVGLFVGGAEGFAVGLFVGGAEGFAVGLFVGGAEGFGVGLLVGGAEGFGVGLPVGATEGLAVGLPVGSSVGFAQEQTAVATSSTESHSPPFSIFPLDAAVTNS